MQASLRKTPRGTFWVGALVGVALGLPLTAIALLTVQHILHAGDTGSTLPRIARLTSIFAGLPAFLTGGGVARLVAHRLAEKTAHVGRALAVGAAAMGVGGAGLEILAAVPVGGVPETHAAWAVVAGVGAISGAVTGLAIGALTGMRMRRHTGGAPAAPKEAPQT